MHQENKTSTPGLNRSVSKWAWAISLSLHAAALIALAVFTARKTAPAQSQTPVPVAKITQAVKALADAEPVTPKPGIRSSSQHSYAAASIQDTWTAQAADTGLPAQPLAADGLDSLVNSRHISASTRTSAIAPGRVEFFGSATGERRVCFVVDCSGSMKGLFSRVSSELRASINSLEPDQYFNIIFFGGESLKEFVPGKLVRATAASKSQALDFIASISPEGKTDALKAMKKALALRGQAGQSPGTIYFLTDGFELTAEGSKAFVGQLVKARAQLAPATQINTIGFWSQEKDKPVLETIAKFSGGVCTIIR